MEKADIEDRESEMSPSQLVEYIEILDARIVLTDQEYARYDLEKEIE